MTRRIMTLVLGLGLIVNSGRRARSQAGTTAKAEASASPAAYTDWKGEGTQGAVAAGGRDAVAAGL